MITLICCQDKHFGIGRDNTIPWKLTEANQHFYNTTKNQTVVMGYNTFQELGDKLTDHNVVVLSKKHFEELQNNTNIKVFNSIEKLLQHHFNRDLYVIGGKQIFHHFIELADRLIISVLPVDFKCNLRLKLGLDSFELMQEQQHSQFKVQYWHKKHPERLSFNVFLEDYNGTLPNLLELLIDKKFNLHQVDIAKITTQYLHLINTNLNKQAIEPITDYLVITSRIVEQKANNLLQINDIALDSDFLDNKLRDKLVAQLVEYKRYRESLDDFEKLRINRLAYFSKDNDFNRFIQTVDKSNTEPVKIEDELPNYVSVLKLHHAMNKLMQRWRAQFLANKNISIQELSIEQVQAEILATIKQFGYHSVSLKRVLLKVNHHISLMYFITAFVALLVLINNQIIDIEQTSFDDELYICLLDSSRIEQLQETPEAMVERAVKQRQEAQELARQVAREKAIANAQKREAYLKAKYGKDYLTREQFLKLSPEERAAHVAKMKQLKLVKNDNGRDN